MQVDEALIDKLSRLSMLRFGPDERAQISLDLEKMIGFVDKLQSLDTEGIAPLTHLSPAKNIFREDIVSGMVSKDQALTNAQMNNGTYFTVPQVIKKKEI